MSASHINYIHINYTSLFWEWSCAQVETAAESLFDHIATANSPHIVPEPSAGTFLTPGIHPLCLSNLKVTGYTKHSWQQISALEPPNQLIWLWQDYLDVIYFIMKLLHPFSLYSVISDKLKIWKGWTTRNQRGKSRKEKPTQTSSWVMTTSPSWQAACRAVRGSECDPAGGVLICSLVLCARRSSTLGRSLSVTADSSQTGILSSGSALPDAGWRGGTNARCSYLARIQDSLSSLVKQKHTHTHRRLSNAYKCTHTFKYQDESHWSMYHDTIVRIINCLITLAAKCSVQLKYI